MSTASSAMQALFSQHSQAARLIRLSTTLGASTLLAECVRGEESLGSGFKFDISALSTDAALKLASLIGQPALLQLMTANSRDDLRPFHGHITAVEHVGANGGFARYRLTLAPWTEFARLGRDSRVFQDMTVCDILTAIFGQYEGKGRLAPAWRFNIAESAIYPRRSLTTQYQESNFAFAERLMAEEGLFYFFEHRGDPTSASLGSHTLVIADHKGAFTPNAQAHIRFTESSMVMKEDGIDRWRTEVRQQTGAIELASWDYRTLSHRPVNAAGAGDGQLSSRDALAPYAYETRQQGERLATLCMQGLAARREMHVAAGTVRTLAPGTTFTLHGQPQLDAAADDDARTFVTVRAVHLMHNNLSAELKRDVAEALETSALAKLMEEEGRSSLHAVGKQAGERPLYRNRIDAIRSSTPYRNCMFDTEGRTKFQRPAIKGQQTAIVVGPPGSSIHTDRDHRVKVQFHWQRGAMSHSRLDHPAAASHSGAPADDSAGTWVRVATPLAPIAGANWGSHALPRVGQEVLVDFLEGDIDRPVIIGALYNGAGQPDAQHNGVTQGAGASTGNAPAGFPGRSAAHAHPAVLSGIKTQALNRSQAGTGAYNQLVLDDSAGQARLSLQRHAGAHQGNAELNLGSLRHQTDNARLGAAGFGAELATSAHAALRAGKGMLLAADARPQASGCQMDAREALSLLGSSHALQKALATTAQKHAARLKNEAAPEDLAALMDMADSIAIVDHTDTGAARAGSDGTGTAPAFSDPQMLLSAPAGIAAVTPVSAAITAGKSTSFTAGHDINVVAQAGITHAVAHGISLLTCGKASAAAKPNREAGISLHAATGKVSVQSQEGATGITADKTVTVASVTEGVTVAAMQHVMLTAQGAMLKLEGGNISLHGPGKISFKAGMKELSGPQSASPTLPYLPKAGNAGNFMELNYRWDDMQPMVGAPYEVLFADGTSIVGKLDAKGHARIENVPPGGGVVLYGEDEREPFARHPRGLNAIYGAAPTTHEEADALLAIYLAQEDAYYKDNYFPDEIETMGEDDDGDGSLLDYEFHYDDYRYADEDDAETRNADSTYRERHDKPDGDQ